MKLPSKEDYYRKGIENILYNVQVNGYEDMAKRLQNQNTLRTSSDEYRVVDMFLRVIRSLENMKDEFDPERYI